MSPLRWFRTWRAARYMRRYKAIMRVLVDADKPLTALDIADGAHLQPGTLYPWLADWERTGAVMAAWVPGPYPRRRVYALTAAGLTVAASHGIRPVGDP